jgi:hypothetical protein
MADFGALGGINSLYGYSSQVSSLYKLKRNNGSLFNALTEAAKKGGASSSFGSGALDMVASGAFDSWNKDASRKAGVNAESLNYLKELKSGGKNLDTALKAASQKASEGGEKAANAVKDIVAGANKLLSAAYKNVGKGSERLFNDITGAVKTYLPSLSRIGVKMGSDGLLQTDEAQLKSASENGEIGKVLSQKASANYGFANRLAKVASNIKNNPSHYANTGAKAVNNTGYRDNQSYNRYSNVGLLLNSLI